MSKRLALLIGVPEYDQEAIPNLPVVNNDVRDLSAVLERSSYLVRRLGTGGGKVASGNNIPGAIEDILSDAGKGDTVLIYFSGHGCHYDGKDWLFPSDGRITGSKFQRFLVHLDFAEVVEASKAANVVFFIDACREGIKLTEKSPLTAIGWGDEDRRHVQKQSFAIVFGCQQADFCHFVDNEDCFSLFTRALTTALDPTTPHKRLGQVLDATKTELEKLCEEHYPNQPPQRIRFKRETDAENDDEIRERIICDGTVLGKRQGDRADYQDPSDAQALLDYRAEVVKQHGYIRFLGLPHLRDNPDVPIDRLYVEPSISESHIQPDHPTDDWPECVPALEAIAASQRLVLLGDPGSGKSTLVSWISWQLTQPQDNAWTRRLGRLVPIPMILRDMELGRDLTWENLLDAFLALPVARPLSTDGKGRERLLALFERGQTIIMLDGLDEVGGNAIRQALQAAVFEGFERYSDCRWLVTSRIVGYDEVPFQRIIATPYRDLETEAVRVGFSEASHRRYVAPFSDRQIEQFAHNWFVQHEQAEHERQQRAGDLVAAIASNQGTQHLARTPNLLTLIALIYRVSRFLPEGRSLLYDRIAEAYLESIDRFRGLDGLNYSLAQKKRWLAYVGYQMQLRRSILDRGRGREILIDEKQVYQWIAESMGEDADNAEASAKSFVDYIARRSGLLLPRGEGRFAFAHLSLQEYFAACHCLEQVTAGRWLDGKAKNPSFTSDDMKTWANESTWRETLVLLFESLADRPGWPDDLVESLYGEDFGALADDPRRHKRNAALLLADVSVDRHAGLSPDCRDAALVACWRWELNGQHETLKRGKRELVTSNTVITTLTHERESQPAMVWGPFQRAASDAAAQGVLRIVSFLGAPVSDDALAAVSSVPGIKILVLINSAITNEGLRHLAGLSTLEELYLSSTKITDDGLAHLASLPELRALNLSWNQITDAGLEHLAGMTGLQRLFLIRTQITDAGLEHLAGMTGMLTLYLSGTPITDAGLEHLAGMTRLQTLNLGGTKITDAGLEHLVGMTGLQKLYLYETKITNGGLEHLAGMTGLKYLNLDNTQITDAGLKHLSGLSSLEDLETGDTRVTEGAKTRLFKSLRS